MSEEWKELFNDYVNRFKEQLTSVDQEQPVDEYKEECENYIRKLDIYKSFTEGLIENGLKYLDIIDHLNEELTQNSFDLSSTSNGDDDGVGILRHYLENRADIEKKAVDSLGELESLINNLLEENCQLVKENELLRAKYKAASESTDVEARAFAIATEDTEAIGSTRSTGSTGSTGPAFDENLAASIIAALTQENDELRKIVNRNKNLKKLIQNQPTEAIADDDTSAGESDCEEQLLLLKKQLAEKENTIKHLEGLIKEMKYSKRQDVAKTAETPSGSDSTDSSGTSPESNRSSRPRKPQRSQSHEIRPTSDFDSSSLTDSEKRDNDKIRAIEKGYKELALVLKEKYEQLRKQRQQIEELLKKLAKCQENEQELIDLKDLSTKMRAQKDKLEEDLKKAEVNTEAFNELKRKSEQSNVEMEKVKERENILARKIALQDEHISTLMEERQNLIKLNNEMLNTIAVCKKELTKYHIEE